MALTPRCEAHLQGVHPDLARVVRMAADRDRFRITEGLRSFNRQKELVASGKSKTMNSRHLTGHAVDFIAIGNDNVATYDMNDMRRVAETMRAAATECGVKIEWGAAAKYGGDFKTFNDSPHLQLPWKTHPAVSVPLSTAVAEAAAKPTAAATSGAIAGGSAVMALPAVMPQIPSPPDLSPVIAWKGLGTQVADIGGWLSANPGTAAIAALVFCVVVGLPYLRRS